ncbi:MAG: class I tRNA ligase family protein, partial [Kiritimatiellae bacterium]|nr:class I tRNA ligase family protein [Kiritimatiellia bacterium]
LYISGADEHGTTAVVGAAREGMPIIEYNKKYYEKQKKAFQNFNLSFDLFGRTHTELQEKLIHDLFTRLDAQGLIEERETIQPYSVDDGMFLADRQLNKQLTAKVIYSVSPLKPRNWDDKASPRGTLL